MSNQPTSNRQGIASLLHTLRRAARRAVEAPQDLGDPRVFKPATQGSGAFGRWTLDHAGLPAYEYTLDQYADPRARYFNTENLDRRDHWHQIGNDRVNALASNDGTIQLFLADRGGVFLNRFEARDFEEGGAAPRTLGERLRLLPSQLLQRLGYAVVQAAWPRVLNLWYGLLDLWYRFRARKIQRVRRAALPPRMVSAPESALNAATAERAAPTAHAYAGGFGYLNDEEDVWATAFRYRPRRVKTVHRLFGMGYYETEITHRQITATRRVYAPLKGHTGSACDQADDSDDAVLLVDVRLKNLRATAVELHYFEYWDVNVHQLTLQWFRSSPFAAAGDDERRGLNQLFECSIAQDMAQHALRFHQEPKSPRAIAAQEISEIDWAPADVFLADLNETPPDAHYIDKHAFFDSGGPTRPAAVQMLRASDPLDPLPEHLDPMPCCMALRRDVYLPPGASVDLRFAYGAVQPQQSLAFLDTYRAGDPLARTLELWKTRLAYFTSGNAVLQREMAWHAYNLQSATVYNEYYETHLVPQGSAYLYSHGADGVPRDQSLYVLPLTYLNPALARETLRLVACLMKGDPRGALPYAFAGYGIQDGARVHDDPSDLDLFFMLALFEYVAATGDVAFLECKLPFYPKEKHSALAPGSTVFEHLQASILHLLNDVSFGVNGLLRISDGDWSDSIVLETAVRNLFRISPKLTKESGESTPNSQMALYVLPRIAAFIEQRDHQLAQQLRDRLKLLTDSVAQQWSKYGNWFTRAILRNLDDEPVVWDEDRINLEAQPWALISDLAVTMHKEVELIESIDRVLDARSPIGAPLTERGAVWPAISQLLTWGYTRNRQDLAWRSLKRNTFAAHARRFPHIWFNIWSGPDGINGVDSKTPGGTWSSPLTPMTDFPVMNANQDAMALLALLRVCGVEPAPDGDGLIIAPKAPPERFILQMRLLHLKVEPGVISGEYHPIVDGARTLYIGVPKTARNVQASIKSMELKAVTPNNHGHVVLKTEFTKDVPAPFIVRWDVN